MFPFQRGKKWDRLTCFSQEPNRIVGYQMGDWNVRAPGEHGSHALKYAFYKVEAYSESYVLILGPLVSDTRRIFHVA